jgi:hypothetical protein
MNKTQLLVDPFIPMPPEKMHIHKSPQNQHDSKWMTNMRQNKPKRNQDIEKQNAKFMYSNIHRNSFNDAPTQVGLHHSTTLKVITTQHQQKLFTLILSRKSIKSWRMPLLNKLQLLLIVLGAFILGPLIQSLTIGEIVITLYGIYAVLRHISSRVTYSLALIMLIGILILYAAKNTGILTANFAIYSFLLMVIGTISLVQESHRVEHIS